jgi:hypothetical protein
MWIANNIVMDHLYVLFDNQFPDSNLILKKIPIPDDIQTDLHILYYYSFIFETKSCKPVNLKVINPNCTPDTMQYIGTFVSQFSILESGKLPVAISTHSRSTPSLGSSTTEKEISKSLKLLHSSSLLTGESFIIS